MWNYLIAARTLRMLRVQNRVSCLPPPKMPSVVTPGALPCPSELTPRYDDRPPSAKNELLVA